ncbi:hypothetical protein GJ496_001734 [Pomphorhynchus laevis]|nr:hypothetical protein GJ496_001734 [Pomphorhynchus laevis]
MKPVYAINIEDKIPNLPIGILLSAWDCVIGPKTYVKWVDKEEDLDYWTNACNMFLNTELYNNVPLNSFFKHKVLFSQDQCYLCIYFCARWMNDERICTLTLCISNNYNQADISGECLLADIYSPVVVAMYDAAIELKQIVNQLSFSFSLIGNWGQQRFQPILKMIYDLWRFRQTALPAPKRIDFLNKEFLNVNDEEFLCCSSTAHFAADGFSIVLGKDRYQIEQHMTFLALLTEDLILPYWRIEIQDHYSKLVPWIRIQGLVADNNVEYSALLGSQPILIRGWRKNLAVHNIDRKRVIFSQKNTSNADKNVLQTFYDSETEDESTVVILNLQTCGQLRTPYRFTIRSKLIQQLIFQLIHTDGCHDAMKIIILFREKIDHLAVAFSSYLKSISETVDNNDQEFTKTSIKKLSQTFAMEETCVRLILPIVLRHCYGLKILPANG